jgi:hypothetical protein
MSETTCATCKHFFPNPTPAVGAIDLSAVRVEGAPLPNGKAADLSVPKQGQCRLEVKVVINMTREGFTTIPYYLQLPENWPACSHHRRVALPVASCSEVEVEM